VSQEVVAEILGKVLRDRAFAERLRAEPETVLATFELTDSERAAIVHGTRDTSASAALEDRPRTAARLM